MLNRHSRLFHIRIDLAIDRLATSDNHSALCDILDYFTQFKKFLSRKKGAFEHLDGYIAHMEYGINKGHHIHISLFFYGQKVKSDYIITQKAKEAWLRITKGTGLFHSTNLDHRHPVCNALQQINRQDTSKLDCLYYVLWYIVKADQFLTYKYHKDQRLFFKGLL